MSKIDDYDSVSDDLIDVIVDHKRSSSDINRLTVTDSNGVTVR